MKEKNIILTARIMSMIFTPWASSGTAATAGASILRSKEDVLP
jgi:hypothetical protein